MDEGFIESLIRVALGQDKADLVILNGKLVNVYSGEILEKCSVAVKGAKIAYVGADAGHTIGDATRVIDAYGKVIAPGFIEGHFHLAGTAPDEFVRFTAPLGTTTIVAELDAAAYLGHEGALALLQSFAGQPVRFLGLASAAGKMPAFLKEEAGIFSREDTAGLLDRPDVLGLGETPSQNIINEDEHAIGNIAGALARGKIAEGHCPGAKDRKLAACAASGISSCHEAINQAEVLDRLRLGMYVFLREGSVRRDLAAFAPLKDMAIDLRRVILATDGISAEDLLEFGHMNYLVQKAVKLGFPPVKAIQMVTLNVAEHFGLADAIGGIAPGKDADIIILGDLEKLKCDYVISRGKIIARDGKLTVPAKKTIFSEAVTHSMNLPRPFKAPDFRVAVKKARASVRVRTARVINGIITRGEIVDMPALDHLIPADPANDILKVSIIDRRNGTGKIFTGFIRGFGLKSGACASSYSWETGSPLVVVGADEDDMARAVNRINELRGGVVVARSGEILAEQPLTIGGFMTAATIRTVARQNQDIKRAVKSLGSPLANPTLTLQTIPCVGLPYFRVTVHGLVDTKQKRYVDLIVP